MKRHFLLKPKFYIPAIIVIVAVILLISISGNNNKNNGENFVVEKRDLIQEVSVTGKVIPVNSAKLAFEISGRVSGFPVPVGASVDAGDILVKLENGESYARLLQAEAKYQSEQIKLDKLLRGNRPEEIEISKAKVTSAEIAELDGRRALFDKIKDGYSKADDAIRAKVDQFMDNPRGLNPRLNFTTDSQTAIYIEENRKNIEIILNKWKSDIDSLNENGDLLSEVTKVNSWLDTIIEFLDQVSFAVNGLIPSNTLSSTVISGYRTDINTARTNANLALSNISSAVEKLRTSQSSLTVAKNQLNLDLAGSTNEDIKTQQALVKLAEASVAEARASYNKTTLKAPFGGTVTVQNAKNGEAVAPNSNIVSIMGNELEIEAYVPEADIAKIAIGNDANITLDAYGSVVSFNARVISIDPAETVIENVSTYRIKMLFKTSDIRIKSGMTANIDIIAAKRDSVIAIPQRVITNKLGKVIVKVIDDNNQNVIEREIKTGIRSSDGYIEILNGLSVGEKVLLNGK